MDKQVPQPSPPEAVPESFTADKMFEYQWPPDRTGEFYLLRHHICQFLEIESLEEKYPGECFGFFSFVVRLLKIISVENFDCIQLSYY